MPATDYLMPHGVEWNELAQLLAPLGVARARRPEPRMPEP